MRIGPYVSKLAEFRPSEPVMSEVARRLATAIQNSEPALKVEHIGSTSVPGCGGKGIIDLAILYPEGLLARARETLDEMGFQRQGGPEPFPEERPMRVGCIEHGNRSYGIHAHVILLGSPEHEELVWFRDKLRSDAHLRRCYEERKHTILASGIRDSLEYCKAKGDFIVETLDRRGRVIRD
jgi:GrpB-like predicted nucleotidyltransferase (UPF0157 family)